jgi:hypothetical protein
MLIVELLPQRELERALAPQYLIVGSNLCCEKVTSESGASFQICSFGGRVLLSLAFARTIRLGQDASICSQLLVGSRPASVNQIVFLSKTGAPLRHILDARTAPHARS